MVSLEVDVAGAQPEEFYADAPVYSAVSPDGKYIGFSRGAMVHIIDRQTGEPLSESLRGRQGGVPAWSRDGGKLAIGDLKSRDTGLWVHDLASDKSTLLFPGPYVRPAFSPDGTKLLFDYAPGVDFASWQVWMVDLAK